MAVFWQIDWAFWGVFEIGVDQCCEIPSNLEPFARIQDMHRTVDLDLGIYAFVCWPWAADSRAVQSMVVTAYTTGRIVWCPLAENSIKQECMSLKRLSRLRCLLEALPAKGKKMSSDEKHIRDEVAIQHVLSRYSESASRAGWDETLSTFMPEGVWEIGSTGEKFVGHAAIRQALLAFTASLDHVVQLNAPGVIKIDGDTATARSVIRESGKFADRDEAFDALGFYADNLVRTADGWKFTKRRFELQGMHVFALLPGSAL